MTSHSDLPNTATIQVPDAATGDRRNIPCTFQGMEGKRLNLRSSQRLSANTLISVEYNDAMFLGEVLACTQDCSDNWHVEVKVEQILTGLESLITLRARLLGEAVPQAAKQVPAAVGAY